jgi:hypothetical protein
MNSRGPFASFATDHRRALLVYKRSDIPTPKGPRSPRGLVGHTLPSAAALAALPHPRPASRKRKPNCSAHRDSANLGSPLAPPTNARWRFANTSRSHHTAPR